MRMQEWLAAPDAAAVMKHSGEERNLIRFERKEDSKTIYRFLRFPPSVHALSERFPQVDDGVQTSGLPLSNLAGCRVTPCLLAGNQLMYLIYSSGLVPTIGSTLYLATRSSSITPLQLRPKVKS